MKIMFHPPKMQIDTDNFASTALPQYLSETKKS